MPSLDLVASSKSATPDPEAIVLGGRLPDELARRIIERITFINPDRWDTAARPRGSSRR